MVLNSQIGAHNRCNPSRELLRISLRKLLNISYNKGSAYCCSQFTLKSQIMENFRFTLPTGAEWLCGRFQKYSSDDKDLTTETLLKSSCPQEIYYKDTTPHQD